MKNGIRKVRYVANVHPRIFGKEALVIDEREGEFGVQFDERGLGEWAYGCHWLPKSAFVMVYDGTSSDEQEAHYGFY